MSWPYFKNPQKGFLELAAIGFAFLGFGVSVVLLSLNSARVKSRDAKRLADVRMLQSGIELYLNDKDQSPSQLKDLQPIYIVVLPVAPLPVDGTCGDSDNSYQYQKVDKKDYRISFCLGQETAGLKAGKHAATRDGIK